MHALFRFALGVLAMALTATGAANAAENGGAVYVVTYFEAAAPDVAKVAADAQQFAAASRKQPGNVGFDAFQEIGRPSRFAFFDGWRDKAASDAQMAPRRRPRFATSCSRCWSGRSKFANTAAFRSPPRAGKAAETRFTS